MENNKLLIAIQFTKDKEGKESKSFELYVSRDILFSSLLNGIECGLRKIVSSQKNIGLHDFYNDCLNIFTVCKEGYENGDKKIILSSFESSAPGVEACVVKEDRSFENNEERWWLRNYCGNVPICDLGFITSTKLIFDSSGDFTTPSEMTSEYVIAPFELKFPEYNISSRLLHKFDDTAISIIAPPSPPAKNMSSLLTRLMYPIMTIGAFVVTSIFFSNGRVGMSIVSLLMSIASLVLSIVSAYQQKQNYSEELESWKTHYESYINHMIIERIIDRQKTDRDDLNTLYPDIDTLIQKKKNTGVYSLSKEMYSRSSSDDDFLTIRLGISDHVPSLFKIEGEYHEEIYSDAAFEWKTEIIKEKGKEFQKHEVSLIYPIEAYTKEALKDGGTLNSLPHKIMAEFQYMKDAPYLYSFLKVSALGIVDSKIGQNEPFSNTLIARIIFELCYYHTPEDLQFVIFFPKGIKSEDNSKSMEAVRQAFDYYRFAPHFHGLFDDKSQFVFDESSAAIVLSGLLAIMNERRDQRESNNNAFLPRIMVIVFDEYGLKEHAFAEYLPSADNELTTKASSLGLSFIFLKSCHEHLPRFCNDFITIEKNDREITLKHREDSSEKAKITCDPVNDEKKNMTYAFRFLSSIYYAKITQNGKVPSTVDAFELLKVNNDGNPEEKIKTIIKNNWFDNRADQEEEYDITNNMKVSIGKTEAGPICLDLHEKADGPHMIVAGTTGSGKTESIITFLISLCAKYRPDELNLLLLDMKGGGFTKRLADLPHIVGKISDVDGAETFTSSEYMLRRFLSAIKSEVEKRKRHFNEMMVDNIDDYITAWKSGKQYVQEKNATDEQKQRMIKFLEDPQNNLTHLILVIDEFTELKRFSAENSGIDFMGEVTSLARIGRSLGFHIILISQNIEGAITDDIRVNSKSRLCLKVATKQASKEMLGTDVAASPQMPGNGRAYLLVGNGTRFEYFQSGYSGVKLNEELPTVFTGVSMYGKYTVFYNSVKDKKYKLSTDEQTKNTDSKSATQLEVIIKAIRDVWDEKVKEGKYVKPAQIFQTPLSRFIVYDKVNNNAKELGSERIEYYDQVRDGAI